MKRAYPFDDFPLQQKKVNVTEKRANLGVFSHEKIKSVHEKTLSLLYEGSRNLANNNAAVLTDTRVLPHSEEYTASSSSNLRQRTLTRFGQISHVPVQDAGDRDSVSLYCVACRSSVGSTCLASSACSYCEIAPLCNECTRVCSVCRCGFCPQHCVTSYAGASDCPVCLSCCR